MLLMIIVALIVFGLILGSFVNALVWRIHEQSAESAKKRPRKQYLKQLSLSKGRSMCPDCHHELAPKDLVPVFSWLFLKGKCRYCGKPISWQYPLVEVSTALLFVLTYIFWPVQLHGYHIAIFVLWLLELVGFMALAVYDLRWLLLPNKVLYPLFLPAIAQVVLALIYGHQAGHTLLNVALAVLVGGGVFYLLFQVSRGKWIGGGDVKLGWLLGLTAGTAVQSVLFIFFGAVGGTLIAFPLLARGKLQQKSIIPFGPLLIAGAIVTRLFGVAILNWYEHLLRFGS